LPIVVTPFRFRTRRQFWSYCGLGIVMRSPSDWVQTQDGWQRAQLSVPRGLNKRSNRTLKALFEGAATTVLPAWPEDPLHAHYRRLLDTGTRLQLDRVGVAGRHLPAHVVTRTRPPSTLSIATGIRSSTRPGDRLL
jgi:hypothetical protein